MAKKQRVSEEESFPLAPEVSPPPVARELTYEREEAAPPTLTGYGITNKLAPKGWVAYRCTTTGEVEVLTPKRADGTLEGEKQHSAAARMMAALTEAFS